MINEDKKILSKKLLENKPIFYHSNNPNKGFKIVKDKDIKETKSGCIYSGGKRYLKRGL